jgi:hypothetical protein
VTAYDCDACAWADGAVNLGDELGGANNIESADTEDPVDNGYSMDQVD